MKRIEMPPNIRGNWIWRDYTGRGGQGRDESFILFRRTFVLTELGLEALLWISAETAYELWINERLIGGGPRPHNETERAYADCYDVGCALQNGGNVIAVVVRHSGNCGARGERPPGLWCQLEIDRQPQLWTDERWQVRAGDLFQAPRPQIGAGQPPVDYQDLSIAPRRWFSPNYEPDAAWNMPSVHLMPGTGGMPRLDAFPLVAQAVGEERIFEPQETGVVASGSTAWTAVDFHELKPSGTGVCAACAFVFCEAAERLEVEMESFEPTRLFCNSQLSLIVTERTATFSRFALKLKIGWNRLLVLQVPNAGGAGVVLRFPEKSSGEFRLYQDMLSEAPEMWNITGPLRMPLEDATPGLRFERLRSQTFAFVFERLANPGAILRHATFTPVSGGTARDGLTTGMYRSYRLDLLRYGYLRIEVEASAGDVIDFSLGSRLQENGFPDAGAGCCRTHTLKCREGNNLFINFTPGDAAYLLVAVRYAKTRVSVGYAAFDELAFALPERCSFQSSEPWMNRLWGTGLATIRRGAALIPPLRSHGEFDRCLLDSYIDSMNIATVYGDFSYGAIRLRQFMAAQYEDGNIPVLGSGGARGTQLQQLFFLPVWILFNYRQSGDRQELESLLPQLGIVLEFFESMISEDGALWYDPRLPSAERTYLFHDDAPEQGLPTGINALFCRFLLSAREIFETVGYEGSANRCRKLIKKISARLVELNFDAQTRLFHTNTVPLRGDRNRLFVNLGALLGGVLPLEQFENFFYAFFNFDPPFERYPESNSPYFNFLFTDMLFSLGLSDWAFRYFRDYWERRRCRDTAAWKVDGDKNGEPIPARFSRGWMLAPNPVLVREFAGIRPSDPGYSGIFLNPALSQAAWIDVTVPTPHGPLRVRWEQRDDGVLAILITSAFPVKVLPELSSEQLQATEFELSDNVTLLRRTTANEESN